MKREKREHWYNQIQNMEVNDLGMDGLSTILNVCMDIIALHWTGQS